MWKCEKCNEIIEDNFEVCWNCGNSNRGLETTFVDKGEQVNFNQPQRDIHFGSVKSKYPTLIAISKILKIFAAFTGVIVVILIIMSLTFNTASLALFSLMIGGLSVLVLIALSEIIKVIIDIEINTRPFTRQK